MALPDLLTGLLFGPDVETKAVQPGPEGPDDEPVTIVYECRNCGTTVTPETSRCPACDETEIAEYPIE